MGELFRKFIEFAMGNGIVLIIGLISSPIITRIIIPEELGKASMFTTITSLIIVVITLGRDQSYIRYYNDEKEYNRGKLFRESIKLPLILNLILGLILIVFYKPVSNMIVKESSFIIVLLMLLHSTFSIISNFALLNVRMKQKGKLYSLFQVVNKLTYLIFIGVLFIIFRNSYMTVVLATIISTLVMGGVALLYDRKQLFNFEINEELNTKSSDLLKYGTPFLFSMSIIWIFQSIDKISLRAFSSFEEIGLYTGAMTIITLLNIVQSTFTTFWTPVAYAQYAKEPENHGFFIDINEIVSMIMLLISIMVIALKDIIIVFLGPEYAGAQFIFPFLVFMPIMYTISETTVIGINFSKNTKCHINIAVISAITNVIGNLILVPMYGAKGAAISTGLSYIVFFIARTYYSNKYYKIKYKLKKLWICIIPVYILAAYSSVYKFNSVILYLSILSIIIVLLMYRNIIISSAKKLIKQKK